MQAGKIGKAMWDEDENWKRKKEQHERYESRNESSIEGIMQSLIVSFIIVQKYVEENQEYGYYNLQDVDGRDSFGIPVLTFMVISAFGSLISGIVGTFKILCKWPLRMEFGTSVGNKILLAAIIIFGMISRFGAFSVAFIFATDLQPDGLASKFAVLLVLAVVFGGFQFILCLIPLQGLGPLRFWNLLLSYPHIHIIPLITPFTFGLVCDEGCCCHCCSFCGCSKPRLALSKSFTLANHIITTLLMIPPIAFFCFVEYWGIVAVQLCILLLGLIAVPILLFQPGKIVKLGILDNIGGHLISNVKGGGRVFRLTTAKPVQKSTIAESVQESTTLYSVKA